jgi:hypothetical protein
MDLAALGASPIGRLVPIRGTDGRTGDRYDSFAYLADPRTVRDGARVRGRGSWSLSLAVLEILNYVAAARLAFEWIEDRSLTSGLMSELQRTLVRGTAGEDSDAGGLRDRQVFIGPTEVPIAEARFVPAPYGDQLQTAFEAWVRWVNREGLAMPPGGTHGSWATPPLLLVRNSPPMPDVLLQSFRRTTDHGESRAQDG